MPLLPTTNSFESRNQSRASVQLTLATVSAIAASQIKTGLFSDFADLVENVAKKPELLQSIKPSQVKTAAKNLMADEKWPELIHLVCAIAHSPKLLAVIEPEMIAAMTKWLMTPDEAGNKKSYNLNAMTDYCELVQAISSHKNLMAVIKSEDVVKTSASLADHFSSSYDQSHGRGEPRIQTTYYAEKADAFLTLASAIKKDQRLTPAIATDNLKKAVTVLWQIGVQGTNEYATDQGYAVEVPKSYRGFQAFSNMLNIIDDSSTEWQEAVADEICTRASKGMPHRTGVFSTKAILQHPWAMNTDQFTKALNAQPNNDCMLSMLVLFNKSEYLQEAYPAAIKTWLAAEMLSTGEPRIYDDLVKELGENILKALRDLTTDLIQQQDYAALSRMSHNYHTLIANELMQDELSKNGLHILTLHGYDRQDEQLMDIIGHRNTLDIIFRKATADAIVCADPIKEFRGYTCTQRLPRDTSPPATSIEAFGIPALNDAIPAIRLGFDRASKSNDKTPVWVQQIADTILDNNPKSTVPAP